MGWMQVIAMIAQKRLEHKLQQENLLRSTPIDPALNPASLGASGGSKLLQGLSMMGSMGGGGKGGGGGIPAAAMGGGGMPGAGGKGQATPMSLAPSGTAPVTSLPSVFNQEVAAVPPQPATGILPQGAQPTQGPGTYNVGAPKFPIAGTPEGTPLAALGSARAPESAPANPLGPGWAKFRAGLKEVKGAVNDIPILGDYLAHVSGYSPEKVAAEERIAGVTADAAGATWMQNILMKIAEIAQRQEAANTGLLGAKERAQATRDAAVTRADAARDIAGKGAGARTGAAAIAADARVGATGLTTDQDAEAAKNRDIAFTVDSWSKYTDEQKVAHRQRLFNAYGFVMPEDADKKGWALVKALLGRGGGAGGTVSAPAEAQPTPAKAPPAKTKRPVIRRGFDKDKKKWFVIYSEKPLEWEYE